METTPPRHDTTPNADRPLAADLRDRILTRLGLASAPRPDLAGLRAIYRAWCAHVPFDNLRKMIALRSAAAGPLPGMEAADFFEHWLAHGTGGTCWPTSNALCELLLALGFDARRVAASMRDLGMVTHASVKVRIGGADWLADSSMLTNVPLPLTGTAFRSDEPAFPAEVEADGGTHVIWTHTPPNSRYLPCRILVDPSSRDEYLAGYEKSRERSPFNQRVYVRRNRPGELRVLIGPSLFVQTQDGVRSRELSAAEIVRTLREEMGYSGEVLGRWTAAGGLEASFEPPSGPKPPPETRLPPSQR